MQLMVAAADAFGLTIVAAGVESAGRPEALRRLNVGSCQGFYFSAPQPPERINTAELTRGRIPDVA